MADEESRVYFFEHVETGYIKIGCTTKPLIERARQIMAGDSLSATPPTIKILAAIWGDRATEYTLHSVFESSAEPRGYGPFGTECFRPTAHLLGFIDGLEKGDTAGVILVAGRNKRRREWVDDGEREAGLGCDGQIHHDAAQHLSTLVPMQRFKCAGVEDDQ